MKKQLLLFLFFGLLAGSGCRPDPDPETDAAWQRLQLREAAVARREQHLMAREARLAQLEQPRQPSAGPDSTRQGLAADTSSFDPVGNWAARMSCTETDCPGSAVGDTKSEQWHIRSVGGQVQVQATVLGRVVREYRGTLAGPTLSLVATPPPASSADDAAATRPDARITVELRATANSQRLEGRREISRPGSCRIVYALELTKPQPLPLAPAP